MNTTYTYDEAVKMLNAEKSETVYFKDMKEKYSLSYCWDEKIKCAKENGGFYKDISSYSESVQNYLKTTELRKYVGHYPFEKLQ